MAHSKRVVFVSLGLLLAMLAVSAINPVPRVKAGLLYQCVTCGIRYGCQACVGGGAGSGCYTLDCSSCTVDGNCHPDGIGAQLPGVPSQVAEEAPLTRTFTLAPELIAKIGHSHTRFAATLANISALGLHAGTYEVHWTPVPLGQGDLNAFLHRKENPKFFARLNKEASAMNQMITAGVASEIVYRIDVKDSESGLNLKLSVTSGSEIDRPITALAVKAVRTSRASEVLQLSEWSVE